MIAPSEKPRPWPDAARSPYTRDAAGLWADIPAFTSFAHEIEQALVGPDLSYPERQRLLTRAAHYGIRRFDANLIIAMVQNRAGPSEFSPLRVERVRPSLLPAILVFAVLQSLILVGAWWAFG